MESLADSMGVPVAALYGAGVLVVLQLTLQITALVQLIRTPAERVTIDGRKWVWALIIILGEIIGPIVWFVAGRKPAPVEEQAGPSGAGSRSAADALYGAPKDSE